MNILFYIPFDRISSYARYDGSSIRTGGVGLSGTHQSFVLAAEYVAKNTSHSVYFLNYGNGVKVNGVTYVNDAKELPSAIHVLVMPTWSHSLPIQNLSNLQHIIVWYQCPDYTEPLHQLLSQFRDKQKKISFVHVSQWSKDNVYKVFRGLLPVQDVIIPNPLMIDCLPPNINFSEKRPHNSIFIACWERGGSLAERCWKKLKHSDPGKWGELIVRSYSEDGKVRADKAQVYKTLCDARYFVYPLINLENGLIHRDTFACVVAEAIACGVEVLTYPVAALKEYYEGLVTWIPLPVSVETVDSPYCTPSVPQLGSESQDEVILKLIQDIDKDYKDRESLRYKRAQEVVQRFAPEACLRKWVDTMFPVPVKQSSSKLKRLL
jgi:glycosyltransferase involved in cell wall biosynthesis